MKRFVSLCCCLLFFSVSSSLVYGNSISFPLYYEEVTYEGKVLTGKGVKVGIIDTGIDYHHPDLRKNYRGGYDFIDNDHDPMEGSTVDGESTHGTHVAGIIAGDGIKKGIAPNAELYVYRALSSRGEGGTDTVVKAIEKAMEDNVDVLNLSLGNNLNIPDFPTTTALNKAVEQGITVVVANGNSGPNFWTVGSPAVSSQAISVGAVSEFEKQYVLKSGKERFSLTPFSNASFFKEGVTYTIVDGGVGDVKDLKQVKGKVVLMERGRYTFDEKVKRAKKAGATGVIMMNNQPGEFYGGVAQKVTIPVMGMTKENGERLKKLVKNDDVSVQISGEVQQEKLANFSSKGPVVGTWMIKPDIVAPGVSVFSTVPKGYELMNGTSMAAPYITGVVALLKEAHPDWSNEEIKAALMNTSRIVEAENGKRYHALEQGAGKVQVEKAIHTKTIITPTSLSFGKQMSETEVTQQASLTIHNKDQKDKIYTFALEETKGISFQLPKYVKVKAGEKKTVDFTVKMDQKKSDTPFHDGFLYVKSEDETLHLPFLFVTKQVEYPTLMAFQFHYHKEKGMYEYDAYLPNGALEFTIDLYDENTFLFAKRLDKRENIKEGLWKGKLTANQVEGLTGSYKALVTIQTDRTKETVELPINFD